MKMAAAISPPKSDTWTIATMLGCHGNQGTAAEIAASNDCWEGFDMQDLDWRNDFFHVVAGEIAGRLEAAEEEPGGEEDLVKISLLHHLQGLAHYEIWHYEDSGERFAGIKAIARRHRAAGEPACHDSDYPQAFTEPWVHRIILECVVVAIQRELAAIAAEEALGTAVGGGGDATVLPDVDEYSMMRARALSEAAAGYLHLSGAELDAMGYEPRPFSDAMDEHGAHHPPSTATGGSTSACTTAATSAATVL